MLIYVHNNISDPYTKMERELRQLFWNVKQDNVSQGETLLTALMYQKSQLLDMYQKYRDKMIEDLVSKSDQIIKAHKLKLLAAEQELKTQSEQKQDHLPAKLPSAHNELNDSLMDIGISALKNIKHKSQINKKRTGLINQLKPGMTCMAQYSQDFEWYKAKVLEMDFNKKKVKVMYMEYGNSEWLDIGCVQRNTENVIPTIKPDLNKKQSEPIYDNKFLIQKQQPKFANHMSVATAEQLSKFNKNFKVPLKENINLLGCFFYGCGLNEGSQFGIDNKQLKFIELKLLNTIKIYRNLSNLFIISKSYELISVGLNEYGQLGIPNNKQMNINNIEDKNVFFKDMKIILVSEGINGCHTFIMNSNYEVYSCGLNKHGQCGLSSKKKEIRTPIKIMKCKRPIIMIKSGRNHSLFLTENGQLNGCGGNQYGQLGINKEFIKLETISVITSCKNINITNIACSEFASFIVDDKGKLYCCGANYSGVLGINEDKYYKQYGAREYIDTFSKYKVQMKDIQCGSNHVLCLDTNGNVWTWGNSQKGQCGKGQKGVNLFKPNRIKISHTKHNSDDSKTNNDNNNKYLKFNKIVCGAEHSFIVDTLYNLYGFGCNCSNELILNKEDAGTKIVVPTLIPQRGKPFKHFSGITQIIADYHSTIIALK